MKAKRILITGGTGYVGGPIVSQLIVDGHDVTVLTRDSQAGLKVSHGGATRWVVGDLQEDAAVRQAVAEQDVVIHNAICWDELPTELELNDPVRSVQLFRLASEAGVEQLIYTSSTAVHRPFLPLMDEGQILSPMDFYGATKVASEAFLSAFSYQTAMRCFVVRPGPVVGRPIGNSPRVRWDRRVNQIVQSAQRGDAITIAASEGRQFIGLNDLARVYSRLVQSDGTRQTYVAVAENFTTWGDIASEAIRLSSSRSEIVDTGSISGPGIFDPGKLYRDLGLRFDSRDALTELIEHILSLG